MKKVILIVVFLLLAGVIGFLFWGSSSFNDPKNYNQIVTYHPEVKSKSDTFSVLTYNIGYLSGMTNNLGVERKESLFSSNLEKSISLFKSYDFDFIGLQEVDFNSARSYDYNQFDSLGIHLDFYQGAYSINWDKSYVPFPYFPFRNHFGRIFSGQGFLSKRQLLSNDLFILDKPINEPFYYNAFYIDRILQIS